MSYVLSPLPYSYDALEPWIDAQTMQIHHDKHHQTYVDKLNAAVEKHPELFEKSVEALLQTLANIPQDIQGAIKNHGGGVANHAFFWDSMKKPINEEKNDPLNTFLQVITTAFGSIDSFREQFTAEATNRFGSGWAWLVFNPSNKQLHIVSSANQDSPLSEGLVPLLNLDVWEHAYYLKYQNKRADYIQAWWHVVNWEKVEDRYQKAVAI